MVNITTNHQRLIAIVGPTGAGKSNLAIDLALKFNGEIVNADSRQVYRFMDIGTAKPSEEDMKRVPHHLFDILNPDEDFSLGQYKETAYKTISEIHSRDKLPILVSGSGQYVWATIEGWEIPRIAPNPEYRQQLERIASEGGGEELFQQLLKVDPIGAQKIDKRNIRRVIRALEVSNESGKPFSQLQQKHPPEFSSLIIGLTAEREALYQKVDARVDAMIQMGFVDEVRKLLSMGYNFNLPAMNSIGYTQIGMYLRGEISLDETIIKIKNDNHRFIRHQYAWFRLKDERIKWFDINNQSKPQIYDLVKGFIGIE